ncbi:hypothetical protein [Arthrobacter sp. BF1]|uniref:hypothetical protein n=1 Tax=Arthrobacter sp. BF1 TaxID=2821145 RepID=UPI001C4E60C8|nr:hypothetical protein [Arthrobacter sp. BF1]
MVSVAAEMGMAVPECMVGLKYYAQAVPTDIEVSDNTMAMLTNALAETGSSLVTRGIR